MRSPKHLMVGRCLTKWFTQYFPISLLMQNEKMQNLFFALHSCVLLIIQRRFRVSTKNLPLSDYIALHSPTAHILNINLLELLLHETAPKNCIRNCNDSFTKNLHKFKELSLIRGKRQTWLVQKYFWVVSKGIITPSSFKKLLHFYRFKPFRISQTTL